MNAFWSSMHVLVCAEGGAMEQQQQQQQVSCKEQLMASLEELLAGESEELVADAALAVGSLDESACAGHLRLKEPIRRTAMLRLVQQQAGGTCPFRHF
jgi:hypothetical protein